MTLKLSLTPWCGLLDHKRLDVLLPCYAAPSRCRPQGTRRVRQRSRTRPSSDIPRQTQPTVHRMRAQGSAEVEPGYAIE